MSRDWRLMLWGANAGMDVVGILLGVKMGNSQVSLFEGIMLGLSLYFLHAAYTEGK